MVIGIFFCQSIDLQILQIILRQSENNSNIHFQNICMLSELKCFSQHQFLSLMIKVLKNAHQ